MEGDYKAGTTKSGGDISIHALRVEGDPFALLLVVFIDISIHALRVEGDCPAVPLG